uniref:hypothetical protein n=1 Tax=Ornithobacterium rhinotracheale TaxID=28251 RepID=UPI0013E3DBF4|nr:hypothetical protein [Ornithobacterium rhinotracheale]
MINYHKITDIFCIVDDFCNDFEKFTQPFLLGKPLKKKPKISNAETTFTTFKKTVFQRIALHFFYKYYSEKT